MTAGRDTRMGTEMRLAQGGRIDRKKPVRFQFNNRTWSGFEGDTLASALLANHVCLTARSFKYHRPRGIMGAGIEEPSSLVELVGDGSCGNLPITTVPIKEGLKAKSVNCWPSPEWDLMSIVQLFSGLIPAAFYYKTFKWPDWHLYEPSIRRAAGLAKAPVRPIQAGHYETRYDHCDVLIVGAGVAGLTAALRIAPAGLRTLIVDDGSEPGGTLIGQSIEIEGNPADQWIAGTVDELSGYDNVTWLHSATAWGYREQNLIIIAEKNPDQPMLYIRTHRIRAKKVLIATGSIERSLVFSHNDRPGIMMASAILTYVTRYAVKPGNRIALFTNNSSAYSVARELSVAGIKVAVIIDSRQQIGDAAGLIHDETRILTGHEVTTTFGRSRIRGVRVRDRKTGASRRIDCDLLGVSGGWNPTTHLFSQSRGKLEYDSGLETFVPGVTAQDCICIGSAAGKFTLKSCLEDARLNAHSVLRQLNASAPASLIPSCSPEPEYAIQALWSVRGKSGYQSRSFVDIQNDVTLADIQLAIREGFDSVEHVKRYTTAGMGIDQGKTGNINVIGAISVELGVLPQDTGTTTFRSPYIPVDFGSLAGIREQSVSLPYRHTPVTRWNQEYGACMYEAGARWQRPGYYPRPGESFQKTVNRECEAVRYHVGIYDGSPLGKFEIKGNDALQLIELLYTRSFSGLKTGMGRYGIMLTDDGLILDDGVAFKLGENHYLMSTSTGHADEVNRHIEMLLQIHRPQWDVRITPVTTQWSNATICGPMARDLMAALGTDIDIDSVAFPFMTMRQGNVAGIPARVFRVSFTGELSFEINVWSRHALELWGKIMQAGKAFDLTPIGSEANHVLRVEKGFLSLGHEVDGTADPYDLGMGWIISSAKADYLGKRAIKIRRSAEQPRREMVGLLMDDKDKMVDENAPITPEGKPLPSEGFVSACVWSVVHNRSIALALLSNGRNRIGQKAFIRMKKEVVQAEIVEPCFHDPEGQRLRS